MTGSRVCLPISCWPTEDRLLWDAGIVPVDLYEPEGAASSWCSASRKKAAQGYGRWLRWLSDGGLIATGQTPGARVTRANVGAFVSCLKAVNSPYTVMNRVDELYNALRVIQPDGDWRWISRAATHLRIRAESVGNKRDRLQHPCDLIALGERLMAEAEQAETWSAQRKAVQYRDGLMIALLAFRPLRMRNFKSIVIGKHLLEKNGKYWLTFHTDEMKAGYAFDAVLPDALVMSLERYLSHYRVTLLLGEKLEMPASIDALWVSEVGTQIDQGALATRIRKHTKKAFGISMTPHLFRDATATSIAILSPKYIDDARSILGHASPSTTEKHYNQANALVASRAFQRIIASAQNASLKDPKWTP